jgi:hypothetical protein
MIAGIAKALPDEADRTLAATGFPITVEDLTTFNCGDILNLLECSQFSAWGDRTTDGSLVIGRNWDYPPMLPFDTYCVRATAPEEEGMQKTLDAIWFGAIGSGIGGINESGFYIAINDGGPQEPGVIDRPYPTTLAIRMVTEIASHDTALSLIREYIDQKTALNLLYHIVASPAEPGGKPGAWVFEHEPGTDLSFEERLRTPTEDLPQAILVTNTPMVGKAPSESGCWRYDSLLSALSASGRDNPIDLEKAKRMLDDVSVNGRFQTLYSLVVFLQRRELHVAVSRAPESSATKQPYVKVRWEDVWALGE